MGKRHLARESALEVLYRLDLDPQTPDEALRLYWTEKNPPPGLRDYADWLVRGVAEHMENLDAVIQSHSKNWRISRMGVVDRNVLRMATFEFLFEEDIAPAIVINEAVEIARKYSSPEAAHFVNGVLDAIKNDIPGIKSRLKDNGDDGQASPKKENG